MAIPQANNPRDFHKAQLLAIGHFFIMSLPKKNGLDEGREAGRKSKSTHQNDIEVVRIKKGTERPGQHGFTTATERQSQPTTSSIHVIYLSIYLSIYLPIYLFMCT